MPRLLRYDYPRQRRRRLALPNEPNRVVPITPIIAGSLTDAIYGADQMGGTNTIDFDIADRAPDHRPGGTLPELRHFSHVPADYLLAYDRRHEPARLLRTTDDHAVGRQRSD